MLKIYLYSSYNINIHIIDATVSQELFKVIIPTMFPHSKLIN